MDTLFIGPTHILFSSTNGYTKNTLKVMVRPKFKFLRSLTWYMKFVSYTYMARPGKKIWIQSVIAFGRKRERDTHIDTQTKCQMLDLNRIPRFARLINNLSQVQWTVSDVDHLAQAVILGISWDISSCWWSWTVHYTILLQQHRELHCNNSETPFLRTYY